MAVASATPTAVLLPLAHACLQHLAEAAGVRVLHIKGVALHPNLSEGRRASTDCDLLVDPAGVRAYIQILEEHDWEQRTHFEQGSIFGHAAAFFHPVWGTVDLHRTFPGIDADPAATFDTLWQARTSVPLGGRECPVPHLDAQRLLLLAHAARDAMGHRRHDQDVSWGRLDEADRARIDELSDQLGARVPLAFSTGRPERAVGLPGEHVWGAMYRNANPTEVWKARLRDARTLRERLVVLREAAKVNRDHLELRLGRPPTPAEVRREWWDRVGRGVRRLMPRR